MQETHSLRRREESDAKSREKHKYLLFKRVKVMTWPVNPIQFKELEICGNFPEEVNKTIHRHSNSFKVTFARSYLDDSFQSIW